MDSKIQFKRWLEENSPETSHKASSYIVALEKLSEFIKEPIFKIENLDKLNSLYQETLIHQKENNGKYYNQESPSYGSSMFYSAAVGSYMKFLENNKLVLIPEIVAAIQSSSIQEQINQKDFFISKAQKKLEELDLFKEPETNFFKEFATKFSTAKTTYSKFKKTLKKNTDEFKLLNLIAQLISYCDQNAADKNILNEYVDKRTLAKSGVRQTSWVDNLLKYKIDNNNLDILPPSIKNAISHLKHPSSGLPMLSENHREMVAKNLLNTPYNREKFVEQTKEFFKPYFINPINQSNTTWIISNILYRFPKVKRLWFDKVEGLIVCDNTGWIDSAIQDLSNSENIVLWWDKAPTGGQTVIELLDEQIENSDENCFYIFTQQIKLLIIGQE